MPPEDLYRELADDLDVAIFVSDENGTVLDINERAAALVRMTRSAAADQPLNRLLPADVASVLIGDGRQALSSGKVRRREKVTMILPGWGFRYYDTRVIPYRHADESTWLVHLLLDITGRERKEMAILAARENAEAESRARRAFLARMSHEIRTPMNGIIGMTDLALQADPPPEIGEYLGVIRNAADSLLHIINDVLDFAKVESGRMELEEIPFEPRPLLHDVVTLLKVSADERGITLTGAVDDGVPDVLTGDPTRIRQVLINLVGNAVKFTRSGSVRVRLSGAGAGSAGAGSADPAATGPGPVEPETAGREPAAPGGYLLRGEVADTGIGIEPDRLDSLFAPFVQSDPSIGREFGGTGLGLAICRMLTRLMGGDVDVVSTPGKGSTFGFTIRVALPRPDLPAGSVGGGGPVSDAAPVASGGSPTAFPARMGAAAAAPGRLEKPQPSDRPDWRGRVAVLAEDNRVNLLVAEKMLERAGFRVISCTDGGEAFRLWREMRPDILILDIQMPVMDGMEVARAVREIERSGGRQPVPIVALTAHVMDDEREAALIAGMNGWVAKPVKPDLLYAELERLLPPVVSGNHP